MFSYAIFTLALLFLIYFLATILCLWYYSYFYEDLTTVRNYDDNLWKKTYNKKFDYANGRNKWFIIIIIVAQIISAIFYAVVLYCCWVAINDKVGVKKYALAISLILATLLGFLYLYFYKYDKYVFAYMWS